jgi:hypothetical protein
MLNSEVFYNVSADNYQPIENYYYYYSDRYKCALNKDNYIMPQADGEIKRYSQEFTNLSLGGNLYLTYYISSDINVPNSDLFKIKLSLVNSVTDNQTLINHWVTSKGLIAVGDEPRGYVKLGAVRVFIVQDTAPVLKEGTITKYGYHYRTRLISVGEGIEGAVGRLSAAWNLHMEISSNSSNLLMGLTDVKISVNQETDGEELVNLVSSTSVKEIGISNTIDQAEDRIEAIIEKNRAEAESLFVSR